MGLFIADSISTSNYEVAAVQTHLISIVKMDTGLGFNAVQVSIEGAACTEITYSKTLSGPTCTRIDDLVHDTGFTSPENIVIFGVPSGTIMPDGTDISAVAGFAYKIGATGSVMLNHICLAYDTGDCGGNGHWVDKVGGGTTQFPPDVILYHELAHTFHYATGTVTSEPLAENDENDMRDVRSLPHRDTASHNGGCGGGPSSCCIVVSLSTESQYSEEVRRLRYIREHTLRKSQVGEVFFDELHFRYYQFSPEVTSLMGHNPGLGTLIKKWFVHPLIESLEMLIDYSDKKGGSITDFFLGRSQSPSFAHLYNRDFLNELSIYLLLVEDLPDSELVKQVAQHDKNFTAFELLLKHINKQTLQDEYINWALSGPVRIWCKAAARWASGIRERELQEQVSAEIAHWIAYIPLSAVWEDFSRIQTEIELGYLDQFLFSPVSRQIFTGRLIKSYPKYSQTIIRWRDQKEVQHAQ